MEVASVPLFHRSAHRVFVRARVVGLAELQAAPLLAAACASKCAWRLVVSMHISLGMCSIARGKAVDLPNRIGDKMAQNERREMKCSRGASAWPASGRTLSARPMRFPGSPARIPILVLCSCLHRIAVRKKSVVRVCL